MVKVEVKEQNSEQERENKKKEDTKVEIKDEGDGADIIEDVEIGDNVADENKDVEEQVDKFIKHAKKNMDPKKWGRFTDKCVFALGVSNVILLALGTFSVHWLLLYFYTVKFPILIGLRLYRYWKHKWHLFLLDFCYFGNTILLLSLWAFPHESRLFTIAFALSHGPLAWAVLAFRNSLVFHDIDKITSCFIHISPPLVTYVVRWYPDQVSNFWYTGVSNCLEYKGPNTNCDFSSDGWSWLFTLAIPLGVFVGHSILYCFIVQGLCGFKVRKDKRYLTSYRFLTSNRDGYLFRFVDLFGYRFHVLMYGIFNAVYCCITLIPVWLWYKYQAANIVFLCIVALVAIWNGANFYMEVFSKSYDKKQTK